MGKLGDLIVVDRDIMKCPVDEVKDVKVLATVVGGKWSTSGSDTQAVSEGVRFPSLGGSVASEAAGAV